MDSIDFLNGAVRLEIRPSKIHGVGLFATRHIEKGSKLYATMAPTPFKVSQGNLTKLLPEVKEMLVSRWPGILNGHGFIYPDFHMQGFMNHSDTPNYDNRTDTTIRNIEADEEITEDYRNIEGSNEAYPWLSPIDKAD